jgi:hypothetical protein
MLNAIMLSVAAPLLFKGLNSSFERIRKVKKKSKLSLVISSSTLGKIITLMFIDI